MPPRRLPNNPHWPTNPTVPSPVPSTEPGSRLRTGDLYHVTASASIQFAAHPFQFRLIKVHDWSTYHGWVWLHGYQLNAAGTAVDQRTIFVQAAGLRPGDGVLDAPKPRPKPKPRPRRPPSGGGP